MMNPIDVSAPARKRIITRRKFLTAFGATTVGIPLYAAEVSRHEISIERHTIRLAGLPDAFHGWRIVQISDFHYGDFTEPFFLRDIVRRVNDLKPDMVVFTGDYVTVNGIFSRKHVCATAYPCAEILSKVTCPLRYCVLGNHDTTYAQPSVMDALKIYHLPLLDNRFVAIEHNKGRIWLAGSGDASHNQMNLDKAIPPMSYRGGDPVILLLHEPDPLPKVARHNISLMLSGHTHGGQIRIPFLPPLVLPPLGKNYPEGLYHLGRTQLYVNRGIGAVRLPFRFNCPPEITEIILEPADSATV